MDCPVKPGNDKLVPGNDKLVPGNDKRSIGNAHSGPDTQASSNTAMLSTWAVWANMLTTPAATQR